METEAKYQVTCPEPGCGKVFTGANCKAQLAGHSKSHKARARTYGPKVSREDRVPLGLPDRKWSTPSDDGFHYRVFNDNWQKEPGRIIRARKAGYEIVEGTDHIAVGTNEDGSAIRGVLMKIKQEWYDEDQTEKQKVVDKVDDQIMGGDLEAGKDDKRYSPAGIKITSSHTEPL